MTLSELQREHDLLIQIHSKIIEAWNLTRKRIDAIEQEIINQAAEKGENK